MVGILQNEDASTLNTAKEKGFYASASGGKVNLFNSITLLFLQFVGYD